MKFEDAQSGIKKSKQRRCEKRGGKVVDRSSPPSEGKNSEKSNKSKYSKTIAILSIKTAK